MAGDMMTVNAQREARAAAGLRSRAQERLLELMLDGWKLVDRQSIGIVRAIPPDPELARAEEWGRSALITMRRAGLVTSKLRRRVMHWELTRRGRDAAEQQRASAA